MKQSQFSTEQIIKILQLAEREEQTISFLCREYAISETTFYRWRRTYGGLTVNEAARLKELERENSRLKRLLAERDLEVDALKDLLGKNAEPGREARSRGWAGGQRALHKPGLCIAGAEPHNVQLPAAA
jgi:putative transposase